MAPQQKSTPALEVSTAIDRAFDLIARGLYDDAWSILLEAERVALRAGIRSAFLSWGLAVAADYRGDAEGAVKHIMMALKADACSPAIRASHRLISQRVRATFDRLDPADANVSHFYYLLRCLDVVDATATIKYSRSAAIHGEYDVALDAARHAVESEPPTPEGLRHLAHLLAAAGQAEEARARLAEADLISMTFPGAAGLA